MLSLQRDDSDNESESGSSTNSCEDRKTAPHFEGWAPLPKFSTFLFYLVYCRQAHVHIAVPMYLRIELATTKREHGSVQTNIVTPQFNEIVYVLDSLR